MDNIEPAAAEPKPPKKKTAKELEATIVELQAALDASSRKLDNAASEIRALRVSVAQYGEQVRALDEKVGVAKEALIPFVKKTRAWTTGEAWPNLGVQCIRPITWGDLKNAAEAGAKL